MTIEELRKLKYFRYVDEWSYLEKSDPLSCVYRVYEVDEDNKIIKAQELYSMEPDLFAEIPFPLFFDGVAEPLETSFVEEILKKREEEEKEGYRLANEQMCKRYKEEEAFKDSHFQTINPPLKRGAKVKILGLKGKKAFDCCAKDDYFYIDDVFLENEEIFYKLRVVGLRKNRSVYVSRLDKAYKGDRLEIDLEAKEEEDYDYRIIDGIFTLSNLAKNGKAE